MQVIAIMVYIIVSDYITIIKNQIVYNSFIDYKVLLIKHVL